jgi:hypothetical protein
MIQQIFKNDKYADIKEYLNNLTDANFKENLELVFEVNDDVINKIKVIKPNNDESRYNFEIIKKNKEHSIFGYDLTLDFLKYILKINLDRI